MWTGTQNYSEWRIKARCSLKVAVVVVYLYEEIRRRVLIKVCMREIQFPSLACVNLHLKSGLNGKPFARVEECLL